MQSFLKSLCRIESQVSWKMRHGSSKVQPVSVGPGLHCLNHNFSLVARETTTTFTEGSRCHLKDFVISLRHGGIACSFPIAENKMQIHRLFALSCNGISCRSTVGSCAPSRCMTTAGNPVVADGQGSSAATPDIIQSQRIKFKRLDKTAKHIMNILDKEAVEKVQTDRDIPDIKPGYIVQLKVEVPENKRRVSVLKGIVIARRNAGLNTTFRLRRLVAGVGVESVFPLYSPNIKEMKVLDKKKVRRAKLYYLRDRMNPLKK